MNMVTEGTHRESNIAPGCCAPVGKVDCPVVTEAPAREANMCDICDAVMPSERNHRT